MIRKKIDDKIQILLKNCISRNERAMFLIIGDKGRDQISNLHNFYSKLNPGKKLNILWCYKNELGFSNHARKKMKKIKKQMNKGVFELNDENAFDLFISTADIKFCYYHDTQRILGTTFGMLILQDFEAITPNLLCRTIETVQGGGIIIFLLSNMTSLKQLYTLSMDVHSRYRTENNKDIEPRFNERFILSLTSCQNCLCVDDELNLLPITNSMKNMVTLEKNIDENEENVFITKREKELNDLKKSLLNKNPIGPLLGLCKTVDQAKAIMCLIDIISEKNNKNTVSLTSGRGRGKSSSMGLAVASAIVYGYSNIIITAPSPENLKTFFEFLIKGLNELNYVEHKDYTIQEGTGEFKGSIVNIQINRNHKQTIRYILPTDILIFQMAELLIIDEAAAIPLNIVKRIMPDCLTFMASTIQGYEGTGRSLSIKLIDDLRNKQSAGGSASRILKEISLSQAIRYADNDPVEFWLNKLLLLDATNPEIFEDSMEDPSKLELYLVNRDTLFSYHKGSEAFLKKIMSLFVSSHYKNTPNDLQLLSDAPAHKIFVLCKSIDRKKKSKGLPDVYCAIQVCEEGGISKDVILTNNKRGLKPSGDLIPWTISDHYQDQEFAHMTSIRIVRIACHPDCQRMGYGSKALQLLSQYYEGKFIKIDIDEEEEENNDDTKDKEGKKKLKPLLSKLEDCKPPFIYYLGTSFGLTNNLYNFWNKNGYKPLYIALNSNSITGEHSCIMVKPLNEGNIKTLTDIALEDNNKDNKKSIKWFAPFSNDFKHRLTSLLSFNFNKLNIKLCLSILEPPITTSTATEKDESDDENDKSNKDFTKNEIELFLTKFDFKRMELYSRNMTNYNMIIDLIPIIAHLYFNKKLVVSLSYIQAGVLLGVGLQRKSFDSIAEEFNIEPNQLLAMFNKMVKKFVSHIKNIYQKEIEIEEEEQNKKNKEVLKTKQKEYSGNILKEMQKELRGEGDKIMEKDKQTKKKYMEEKLKKMEKMEMMQKKRKRDKKEDKEENSDENNEEDNKDDDDDESEN